QERHFGLVRPDGSPKPAATALKGLFGLLADHTPRARDFSPSPLGARITAGGPVSALPLQDASGRSYLAVWNESPGWNRTAAAPQAVAPADVEVVLPAAASLSRFDVIQGGPAEALGHTDRARLAVGAHPLVLRIG